MVKRSKISENERGEVFKRDNFQCIKCGSMENLSIDHILPFSLGGDTIMSNLQTLCRACNSKKGNRDVK
ncbi:MAG: HNH endonuclease [Candidatus Brocadia sp. WS118]|nr:MAG: HNH endonuclease [Candidatus Brocadia sp. WS118]